MWVTLQLTSWVALGKSFISLFFSSSIQPNRKRTCNLKQSFNLMLEIQGIAWVGFIKQTTNTFDVHIEILLREVLRDCVEEATGHVCGLLPNRVALEPKEKHKPPYKYWKPSLLGYFCTLEVFHTGRYLQRNTSAPVGAVSNTDIWQTG